MTSPMFRMLSEEGSRYQSGGGYSRGAGGRGYGGYGRPKTATVEPVRGREGGLGRMLSRMGGGSAAVERPIQPVQPGGAINSSRGKNIAYASLGLKAISNVIQAIENYQAAKNAAIVAQEENDREKETHALEMMEKSKKIIMTVGEGIKKMNPEQLQQWEQGNIDQGFAPELVKNTMLELLNTPTEGELEYEKGYQGKKGEFTAEKEVFGEKGKPGKETTYDKEMAALREEFPDETDAQLLKRRKELGRDPLMEQLLKSQQYEIRIAQEGRAEKKLTSENRLKWDKAKEGFWTKFRDDEKRYPTQKEIDQFNATHGQLGMLLTMPEEGWLKELFRDTPIIGGLAKPPATPGQTPAHLVDVLPPANSVPIGTVADDPETGVRKKSDGTDWVEF